jgi:hypothetical protein
MYPVSIVLDVDHTAWLQGKNENVHEQNEILLSVLERLTSASPLTRKNLRFIVDRTLTHERALNDYYDLLDCVTKSTSCRRHLRDFSRAIRESSRDYKPAEEEEERTDTKKIKSKKSSKKEQKKENTSESDSESS